jgi:hypothetical protein
MILTLEWSTRSSITEKSRVLPTNTFREIVKRLHSFGLVSLQVESNKITDNVFLQLFVYYDEILQAFEKNEVYSKFEATIAMYGNDKN